MSEDKSTTTMNESIQDSVQENVQDGVLESIQENLDLLQEEEAESNLEIINNEGNVDYSNMGLKEIMQIFEEILGRDDQMEMYKKAEILKASFYKVLNAEKVIAGYVVLGQEATETVAESNNVEGNKEKANLLDNPFVDVEKAFKDLFAKYKARRSYFLQDQEKQKETNYESKLAVIEELKALLDKQEDINLTFPTFRELQNRWKGIGTVPQGRLKDVWDSYQHQVEKFYDYVKINNELRDLDLKKNHEAKIILCERAEVLKEGSSIVDAFKELQELHEEWREFGPVPKEFRDDIWNRFKEATAVINKKHQGFFENIKSERKDNLDKKTEICVEAEDISNKEDIKSNEWNVLSKQMENLQQRWKSIGFAAKKDNQKIYDRFRLACDKFYNAKREYYLEFKDVMQSNLDKKTALCEQAETIMGSEDWKKTTDQLISLQKEWKKVGPVARKQSDVIWKRFRTACDKFFDNKSKHFEGVDSSFTENLEKKLALVEQIKGYVPKGDKDADMTAMHEFQDKWREIGFVPFSEKEKLQKIFKEVMDVHFSGIRSVEGENKLNRFARRMQDIQTTGSGDRILKFERDKLMQKYRKIETDIHTLDNNMGFFAKSKNADAFISDLQKKVELAREELKQIETKIKFIDKQFNGK